MKRYKSTVLSVLVVVFLMGETLQAQVVRQLPPEALQEVGDLLRSLQAGGQRSGGGRGAAPVGVNGRGSFSWTGPQAGGAWWTNTTLVQQLGLTDDQKARIERAYENHRLSIESSVTMLEKEESQLTRQLEAEPLDRSAVLTQIDRVVQARGEMERANSAMTLEMRESLTRAQWLQLESPAARVRVGANVIAANLVTQVEPVYPESARQAGIQGAVVIEAEISREGTVENLRVISGNPMLVQAALDAVKQWRYKPTLLNGAPVAVVTNVTVNFPFSAGTRGAAAPAPSGPGQRRGRGPQ